jgi:hypothetical protein
MHETYQYVVDVTEGLRMRCSGAMILAKADELRELKRDYCEATGQPFRDFSIGQTWKRRFFRLYHLSKTSSKRAFQGPVWCNE